MFGFKIIFMKLAKQRLIKYFHLGQTLRAGAGTDQSGPLALSMVPPQWLHTVYSYLHKRSLVT